MSYQEQPELITKGAIESGVTIPVSFIKQPCCLLTEAYKTHIMLKPVNSLICLEPWWGSLAVQSEARGFFLSKYGIRQLKVPS